MTSVSERRYLWLYLALTIMMKLVVLVVCMLGTCIALPREFDSQAAYEFYMHQVMQEENAAAGKHWALLVAGSNTWGNYRHQADVCHAYQILKAHGLPDERIVVMMYDDLAHNEENPTPGIIINHPNGKDVYHGVPKDYTGKSVTPENFLKILQGEDMKGEGSGKVIKSGPNDHVFVNFVDHGAPGIVGFPDGMILKASQLIEAINKMHKDKKYKQMVLYVEACESGSMFANLPKDINVYATTAANAKESSYACYLDEKRGTYLGDVYSVKWMEDSDKENLNKETLHKQYQVVKRETNTSHVCQFGQLKLAKEMVSAFQGSKETTPITHPSVPMDTVPAPDVKLAILYAQLNKAKDVTTKQHVMSSIKQALKVRSRIEGTMKSIVTMATRDTRETDRIMSIHHEVNNVQCYEPLVDIWSQRCYSFSQYEYALRQLYALVNLCEEGVHQDVIREAMMNVCDGTH